jgi:hypothetical protein
MAFGTRSWDSRILQNDGGHDTTPEREVLITPRTVRAACVCTLAAISALVGCGKREPPQEKAPSQLDAPVGRSDSLINEAAPRVTDWVRMWNEAMPGFRAESLFFSTKQPAFRRGFIGLLEDEYPPSPDRDIVFQVLGTTSPDGRFILIFDKYLSVEGEAEGVEAGEPDSAPVLLDLQERTSNTFAFCGTPCGFHWGVWLSPSSFALAGWSEEESGGWRGSLAIYSLPDSVSNVYVTRTVSSAEFDRYREAWMSWMDARCRAALSSKSPNPLP